LAVYIIASHTITFSYGPVTLLVGATYMTTATVVKVGGSTNRHKIKIEVYNFDSSFRMITRGTEKKYDQNQLYHGSFPSHAISHSNK